MADMKEDVTIYPVMTALFECIKDEFTKSSIPQPAREILWMGAEPPPFDMGEDCDGLVWVRLASSFPSLTFPEPDDSVPSHTSSMGFTLEVGVARCISVGDEDGEGPEPLETFDDTRLTLATMAGLRRAICQCLNDSKRKWKLNTYEPLPTLGGVAAGAWSVTVGWNR